MINQLLAGGIASIAAIAGCAPTAPSTPTTEFVRPAQTIWIDEDYAFTFNAESGDTLNIIMNNPTDFEGAKLRCQDMGGQPTYNPHTMIYYCGNADF
jgi:hypothetical protein